MCTEHSLELYVCVHFVCLGLDCVSCPFCLSAFVCPLSSSLKSASTSLTNKTPQIHRFHYRALTLDLQSEDNYSFLCTLLSHSHIHAHTPASTSPVAYPKDATSLDAHVYLKAHLSFEQSHAKEKTVMLMTLKCSVKGVVVTWYSYPCQFTSLPA